MSVITYQSVRVASRWRLARWEIIRSLWIYCCVLAYNYLAHHFIPQFSVEWPTLFKISFFSVIVFILSLVFPGERFYVSEFKVNEFDRSISIRYYHPYDDHMAVKIPFDQLHVRLHRSFFTNKIFEVELYSKKTGTLSIVSGRYSLSSQEIIELGSLLEEIIHPKTSRKKKTSSPQRRDDH